MRAREIYVVEMFVCACVALSWERLRHDVLASAGGLSFAGTSWLDAAVFQAPD